jgi:bacillithiol system protein YtxJ
MINWLPLHSPEQLEEIVTASQSNPCVIFKHSTKCGVSSFIQLRLEEDWNFSEEEVIPFLLDVIANREVARLVAETFSVHHESPQLLLLKNGECTYDASHLDISVSELRECFHDT